MMNLPSEPNTSTTADDCFEVDDIAALDPIEPAPALPAEKAARPAPVKSAPKSKAAKGGKSAKPAAVEVADMEIELSADDMDAMLEDDVINIDIS
jgi:hypothetical protein